MNNYTEYNEFNWKVKKPAEAEKYRLEKIAEAQAKKVKQPQKYLCTSITQIWIVSIGYR